MKDQFNIPWNVTSIVLTALVFGLAVGLPIGSIVHQLYASTPSTDLAISQQKE